MWFVEPGHERKRYRSHETREEFYYVLSGPDRMRIAGGNHTVPEGTAIRIDPGTKRKTFTDIDREHVRLVVDAPAVDDPGIVHDEA
nr:cupin domain-containing protein [Halobellus ruber]